MSESNETPIGHNNPPTLADEVAAQIQEEKSELEKLKEIAEGLPKTLSEHDIETVSGAIRNSSELIKQLEAKRTLRTGPLNRDLKTINGQFRALSDSIGALKTALTRRLTEYQQEVQRQERARLQAEAKAREEAAAKAREEAAARAQEEADVRDDGDDGDDQYMDTEVALAEIEANNAAAAAQSFDDRAAVQHRSDDGTLVSSRQFWDFEIEDIDAIPLDRLRLFLPRADIEKAIRAFLRHNKDRAQLRGVRFFLNSKATVR